MIPPPTGIQVFENGVKKEIREEIGDQDDVVYEKSLNARWKALAKTSRKKHEKEAAVLALDVERCAECLLSQRA